MSQYNKIEIALDCRFYMPENIISNFENRALNSTLHTYGWQIIIKEALLHIYECHITKYSAVGTSKGNHPAINRAYCTMGTYNA